MLTARALLYETLLANTWMEDQVRIDLRLSRRSTLALSKLIEIGLKAEEGNSSLDSLQNVTEAEYLEFTIPAELRKKANLTEMYEKLSALVAK